VIGTLFQRVRDVHFVGIGGVGMSGIAEILLSLGFGVSGSDLRGSETTKRLESLGAKIWIGHHESHLEKADVVVFSSAVSRDNPEILAAHDRRIAVIPRAEMLAELMRMQTSIAVAGMHGKTTTTSMISSVLSAAGYDPTVIIGGKVDSFGGGARLGHGELLVAEADESDRSFLRLYPTIAIVTNMDLEHLDCYGSMEEIRGAFLEFIDRIPFYGYAVLCLDDPEIQKILPRINKRVITYGLSSQAAYRAVKPKLSGGLSGFGVFRESQYLGEVTLPMPGLHNVVDALAAICVADIFEVPFQVSSQALDRFLGVQRRFTPKGTAAGVTVIDDYGHHPTEIRAVLQAAVQVAQKRIAVIFQPHRYTRTKALFEDFLGAFNNCDLLYVLDVYAASEKPMEDVTGEALCPGIKSRGHKSCRYLSKSHNIPYEVASDLQPRDIVITLGAGDVTHLGPKILEELRAKENRQA